MVLSILFWIVGIFVAVLVVVGIMVLKVIWLIMPWVIFVLVIAAIIASGLHDLSNKNKPLD